MLFESINKIVTDQVIETPIGFCALWYVRKQYAFPAFLLPDTAIKCRGFTYVFWPVSDSVIKELRSPCFLIEERQ